MFNILSATGAMVRTDDKPLALDGLARLGDLLHYALSNSARLDRPAGIRLLVRVTNPIRAHAAPVAGLGIGLRGIRARLHLAYGDAATLVTTPRRRPLHCRIVAAVKRCPMSALKVLIVDDEAHARTNLRLALEALPGWEVVAECAGAGAARGFLAARSGHRAARCADAGGIGLDLARELSGGETPPLVVFVTAHRGHALDAFDAHALDYIVKPVSEKRPIRAAYGIVSRSAIFTDRVRTRRHLAVAPYFAENAKARHGRKHCLC